MRQLSGGTIDQQSRVAQLSRLQQAHRSLSEELEELGRRAHLTPTESARMGMLKKQKLLAKDKIRVLVGRVIVK